jgi:hypothetical protein
MRGGPAGALACAAVVTAGLLGGSFAAGRASGAGGPETFTMLALLLTLPHAIIGDLFRWRRFPDLAGGEQMWWVMLAAIGLALFFILRGTARYLSFVDIYFIAHFWKDLDLSLRDPGEAMDERAARRPKRWCGLIALAGYTVVSSGYVTQPAVLAVAEPIVGSLAVCLLAAAGALSLGRRGPSRPIRQLWARYAVFAAALLLASTWIDANYRVRRVLPAFLIIWHFMFWYALYYWVRSPETGARAAGRGLWGFVDRLHRSPAAFTVFILAVNGLLMWGAWHFQYHPSWRWPPYVYSFDYLAGGWTLVHITCDWVPKRIAGVRLSLV